jgi:hypothetical protein
MFFFGAPPSAVYIGGPGDLLNLGLYSAQNFRSRLPQGIRSVT